MIGLVVKSMGLWYEVELNGVREVARLKGKMRLDQSKVTNPVAVGDQVELVKDDRNEKEYLIEAVHHRKNYLIRKSPRKKGHDHVIASNLDQGVLIVTLKMPRTSVGFIDRFLISLEAYRIPGVIIFNKKDLYRQSEFDTYNELKEIYENIGHSVYLVSLMEDVDNLRHVFEAKASLLSGHSGAGKSTLVNKLIKHAKQETDEVSTFANKGKHTTTFAEMFWMNEKSTIIDTPGIKELGLAEISKNELSHYFPEMRAFLGQCKFHNCLHENEIGCAIKAKVGEEISELRYKSYLSILNEEDTRR